MIRKSDVQWWIQQARKEPGSAPSIIEALAGRLAELDAENEQLRNELVQRAPAATSSAQVNALQRKVSTLEGMLKSQAANETAVVLLLEGRPAARVPLSQVRLRLRAGRPLLDHSAVLGVRAMLAARPQDTLLAFSGQGGAAQTPLHKIPFLVDGGAEQSLHAGATAGVAFGITAQPRFWTIVTRRGYVRQLLRIRLEQLVGGDELLVKSPIRNDEPIAIVDGDRGDLLLVTRWGKAVRFPQRAIGGGGSVALELEPDDEVAAALPLPADTEALVLTTAGYALRRDTTRFGRRTQPGGPGRTFIRAYDVLGLFPYAARGKLLYLTYSSKLAAVGTAGIPLHSRAGKGTQVQDFSRDPAVAVTFVPGALL